VTPILVVEEGATVEGQVVMTAKVNLDDSATRHKGESAERPNLVSMAGGKRRDDEGRRTS